MRRILIALALAVSLYAQTASFPTAIATDQALGVAKDTAASTLSSGINNSTLTIPVVSGAAFAEKSIVLIGTEQVLICTIAGNTLTACTGDRGFNGTAAASHLTGATVRGIVSSFYVNAARIEIQAIESALGVNLNHPLRIGTTPPVTCTVGDMFYDTDATAGQNLVGCTATNTWTVQAGGGDSLGSAVYSDVVALWTTCTGYLKSDGTCDTSGTNALTQAIEFDAAGAVSVSVGASGRAQIQTPVRVDSATGAISNTSTAATLWDLKDQTSDPAAPGGGRTEVYALGGALKARAGVAGAAKTFMLTDTVLVEAQEPAHDGDATNSAGDLTLALAAKHKTLTKSLTLLDPVAGDSGSIQMMFPYPVTITRVACSTKTATSTVTLNFEKRAAATPDTAGTSALSADLVADTNQQTSCASGCDVNTITSAAVAANIPLALTVASVANAPAVLRCFVTVTVD